MEIDYDVAVLGSGPAGFTAAIYLSRANLKVVMFAGDKWGGQLMLTTDVENYPGFPEGVVGAELMERMKKQAERFGTEVLMEVATGVRKEEGGFVAIGQGKGEVRVRSVVMAMGADTKWLEVPGEEKLIGRGVSSCAPCDAAFFRNKRVFVVGGGDSAMEEATFLTRFATEVTVIHRRDSLRASKFMQNKAMSNEKIGFFWHSEIVEVLGSPVLDSCLLRTEKEYFEGHREALLKRGQGEVVEEKEGYVVWKAKIDGIFVAIGHMPNTSTVCDLVELDVKGYIKSLGSNWGSVKQFVPFRAVDISIEDLAIMYPRLTSVEGIFVAGDVHDHHYRQAVTAAGFGCQAALDCERWLENLD